MPSITNLQRYKSVKGLKAPLKRQKARHYPTKLSSDVRRDLTGTGIPRLLMNHDVHTGLFNVNRFAEFNPATGYEQHTFLAGTQRFKDGAKQLNTNSQLTPTALAAAIDSMQQGLYLSETVAFDMMTNTGRHTSVGQDKLETLIRNRVRQIKQTGHTENLRDIYSVGIMLGNMTDLNTLFSTSAGTLFKDLAYRIVRAYYDAGSKTVDDFLSNFDVNAVIDDYASDANIGQVTTVNSVIINVQTQDLDATTDLIDNLPFAIEQAIIKLLEAGQTELCEGFEVRNGKLGYSIKNSKNREVAFRLFSEANPHKLVAGISTFDKSLDAEFLEHQQDGKLANDAWIQTEIARMIDDVVQKAEWADKNATKENRLFLDIPEAERPAKLAWRMGRHLTHKQILEGLKHIQRNADKPFDPYANEARTFRKFTYEDLVGEFPATTKEGVLELAAKYFKANLSRLPDHVQDEYRSLDFQDMGQEDIALFWLQCLERDPDDRFGTDDTRHKHQLSFEHMAYGLQFAFMDHHGNAQLDALFKDLGGVVRPLRWFRRYDDYIQAAQDLKTKAFAQDADLKELTKQATLLAKVGQELLDLTGYNIITGDTVPISLAPDYTVAMLRNHYAMLAKKGIHIPNYKQGYFAVGVEAKNAKVIEDVAPITSHDKLDKHMGLIRRVARFTLTEIFGTQARDIMPSLMISTDPTGDEIEINTPQHDLQGQKISPAKFNAFRKAMQKILNFDNLHYNHKQAVAQGTLRHKMWRTEVALSKKLADNLGVRRYQSVVIAAAKDAFASKQADQRAWILSIDGKTLKNPIFFKLNKNEVQLRDEPSPYLGPINVRICVIERNFVDNDGNPLNDTELRDLIADDIALAMDLDNMAKKQPKPEVGAWLYNESTDSITRVMDENSDS